MKDGPLAYRFSAAHVVSLLSISIITFTYMYLAPPVQTVSLNLHGFTIVLILPDQALV